MATNRFSDFVSYELTFTFNAVASNGTVDSDEKLPKGFTVLGGFGESEALTTNNTVDIGITGTDVDLFIDGMDPSAGAVVYDALATAGGAYGYKLSADTTVTAKNVGSAATPSSDKTITLTVFGVMDFSYSA